MGKFEFTHCPFGLTQVPGYFQRLINKVLHVLDFAFGCLDDILVFSLDIETHLTHLEIIFQRLREADLKLSNVHIQYLGHLVSDEGITPLLEKLESIQNMPPPRNPKEVKQFLGLMGYYCKFIPRFADIVRPMTALSKKDVELNWTTQCHETFNHIKKSITTEPILKYPDSNRPNILLTDASKYTWSCVLTQAYHHEKDGKNNILHPITYMTGLCGGSQLNWAALTKEAYAIYMSVKKLTYYLEDSKITLHNNHLPLREFWERNTLNSKVNNWAVEISPFKIKFEYIKGIKNTLTYTMSRLIDIDSDIKLEPEPKGHEYWYYSFKQLPSITTKCNKFDNAVCIINSIEEIATAQDFDIDLGIAPAILQKEQNQDRFCKNILNLLARKGCNLETHITWIMVP